MKINVDEEIYNIAFQHDKDHKWTTAEIHEPTDTGVDYVWVGVTECSPKDTYNKILGRKIALSRAMENADFPKEVRTKIWNALKERGMSLF